MLDLGLADAAGTVIETLIEEDDEDFDDEHSYDPSEGPIVATSQEPFGSERDLNEGFERRIRKLEEENKRLQAKAEALSGAHVGVSAFSAFGRLSVIRPTPPARVSCKMEV